MKAAFLIYAPAGFIIGLITSHILHWSFWKGLIILVPVLAVLIILDIIISKRRKK